MLLFWTHCVIILRKWFLPLQPGCYSIFRMDVSPTFNKTRLYIMKKLLLAILASGLICSAAFAASNNDGTSVIYLYGDNNSPTNQQNISTYCPHSFSFISNSPIGPGYIKGTNSQGTVLTSKSHTLPSPGVTNITYDLSPHAVLNHNGAWGYGEEIGQVSNGVVTCYYQYYYPIGQSHNINDHWVNVTLSSQA